MMNRNAWTRQITHGVGITWETVEGGTDLR